MTKCRLSLTGLLLVMSATALAQGPTSSTPAPVLKTPPLLKPLPMPAVPTSWSVQHAYEQNIRDSMQVGLTSRFGVVPVLAGFRMLYTNGDHKLRRVGAYPAENFGMLAFSDQNGDDPFNGVASWVSVGAGKSNVVHAAGSGRFNIPLGQPVPNHTLVLAGFEFRRRDGTDANVRAIGVWLDSQRASARVMLLDDQGVDFRGFERTLGNALLLGLAPGAFDLPGPAFTGTIADLANRARSPSGEREYSVSVYYAWIPNQLVESTESYSGTSRKPSSNRTLASRGVIQGFDFYFGNSDHHLLDIGVLGPLMKPLPGGPPSGEAVAFQDNDRDDPIHWAVQMVQLKSPKARP